MAENNVVIEIIMTELTNSETEGVRIIGHHIRNFERLNRAGRKRLVQEASSQRDWLEAVDWVGAPAVAVTFWAYYRSRRRHPAADVTTPPVNDLTTMTQQQHHQKDMTENTTEVSLQDSWAEIPLTDASCPP